MWPLGRLQGGTVMWPLNILQSGQVMRSLRSLQGGQVCGLLKAYSVKVMWSHRSLQDGQDVLGVLSALVAQQHLLPIEHFAAHPAGHRLGLAKVDKAHVAPRVLRIGVDLAAQLAGHAVRGQVG